LIREAGLHADRLSVNIELPSDYSLRRLAGDKTYRSVLDPMGVIRETILETREMLSYSGPFPMDFVASNAYEETCRQLWKTYFIAVNITLQLQKSEGSRAKAPRVKL
jgi:hypothetical protein